MRIILNVIIILTKERSIGTQPYLPVRQAMKPFLTWKECNTLLEELDFNIGG